jgi:exosome complex exonuclease RRP6
MDASQDFKSLQESIKSALVATTRTVNGLANEDLTFQRTVNPSVRGRLDDQNEQIMSLASKLLASAGTLTRQRIPSIEDAEDIEIGWRGIVDVIDSLLEKADTCLDEYTGLVKRKDAPTAESVRSSNTTPRTLKLASQSNRRQGRAVKKPKTSDKLDWSLKRANIVKPQNAFERKTDNFDVGPWKPLLSTKPHATVALEQSLGTFVDEQENEQYDYTHFLPLAVLASRTIRGEEEKRGTKEKEETRRRSLRKQGIPRDANDALRYKHPYETEILDLHFPARVYEKADAIPYLPVETTAAIWVDSYDQVLEMLEELKKAKEIAVDLEHHDYRTYTGLLSLMQISTREKDWIVDTLVPWRHKLEVLNEVFTDPNIIKVYTSMSSFRVCFTHN